MSTIPTKMPTASSERRGWTQRVLAEDMWVALAIMAIWLTVLLDALYGPDFVSSSGAGTNTTTIPSAVFVALFAYLATRVIARYGFGQRGDDD